MKKGVATLALLFFVVSSYCHDHSHGHDHSHDHSHEHSHSHEHAPVKPPRQQKPKIPDSSKYEVQKEEPVPVAIFRPSGVWGQALLATALIGVAPILILFVVPLISVDDKGRRVVNHSLLKTLLGFAVGGLLGDVFLHLLPHAMNPHSHGEESHGHSHGHSHDEPHDHSQGIVLGLVILAGIFSFFIIEKIMRIRSSGGQKHSHSHSHSKKDDDARVVEKDTSKNLRSREKSSNQGQERESSQSALDAHTSKVTAYLNMIADAAHNFTDGMAIGASFLIHPTVGWSTTVAVFFHEIPHELGDYAILVQSGYSKHKAMLVQLGTALGAVLGTIVALIAGGQLESVAKYILPFTAGGFIYIATVDVIPELLEDTSVGQTIKELITMSLGVGIMALIAIFE